MAAGLTGERSARGTAAGVALVTVGFAALAWHRRWMSDDGLIVVRTVRQILAGNGPVFNPHERVESSTSVLWTWLVAAVAALTGRNVARLAVELGLVCAVAGVALAVDATRRLHRVRGSSALLAPAAALVPLATPPFWDYATSGLESGLCMLWIGASWWLLVALRAPRRARVHVAAAVVLGLGPLVRPELALAAAVFLVAGWWQVRPARARTAALAGAAIALPLGYEVFRAGYYGVLVPLPALAKSAAHARWLRGLKYAGDYAHPYWLWVPGALLVGLLVVALRRGWLGGRDRVLVAAPVIAAGLVGGYVVRVGGDFMHARLLLPATLLALLPGLVLPLRRATAPVLAAVAVWALAIGLWRSDGRDHTAAAHVNDERVGYVRFTGQAHPVDAAAFVRAAGIGRELVADAVHGGERALVTDWGDRTAMHPDRAGSVVLIAGRLGTGGAIVPLDGIVGDTLGLANPIGARIPPSPTGAPGHEKQLHESWWLADYADPAADPTWSLAAPHLAAMTAARHALTCGELAELLASVRAPMTAGRFWANLTGAIGRTRLVIPADPIEAERRFCGPR